MPGSSAAIDLGARRDRLTLASTDAIGLSAGLPAARVATICDDAPVAIAELDRDRRIRHCNSAFCAFFGCAPEELVGRRLDAFALGDDAHAERLGLARLLGGDTDRVQRETRFRHADGRLRWAETRTVPLHDERNSIDGLAVTVIDIAGRKRLEQRLESLAAIVEQSDDLVAVFDPTLELRYINPAGLTQLGVESHEALGRLQRPHLLDWVWPEDLPDVKARVMPAIAANGFWSGQLRYRRADEECPAEALFRVSAIRDDEGEIVAYALNAPDLSGLLAVEDALRRSGEELAEANRQKDRVLSRLGHELRTPMNALVNGLDIIRSGTNATDQRAMLTMMTRQCGQLGSLIDDLVDVARAQSGQLRVSPTARRVDTLLEEVAAGRRYETEPLGIRLVTTLGAARGARALIDEHRLRQVLDNLLGNAIRATRAQRRAGIIEVTLSVRDTRVAISVADNGCGIAAADLVRIFAPFERVGDERADGGLGLGLAIARELTEQHGGELAVASEGIGHGARFTIELPLLDLQPADEHGSDDDDPDPDPDTYARPGGAAGDPATNAGARAQRIVLIDDEADAGDAMRRVLQRFGHDAHRATDGAAGIALACRLQPDVVICDIGMPGMDGFEVARALRSQGAFADTRLIALTGFADERTAREAREAGFDEHVAKPIYGRRLQALING